VLGDQPAFAGSCMSCRASSPIAASIVSCRIVSCSMACDLDLVFICAMDNGTASSVAVVGVVVAGVAAFLSASNLFCKRVYSMAAPSSFFCRRV